MKTLLAQIYVFGMTVVASGFFGGLAAGSLAVALGISGGLFGVVTGIGVVAGIGLGGNALSLVLDDERKTAVQVQQEVSLSR